MLNLPEPPKRMESFDISNTGKSDIVASMVVYSGTRPLKSAYRRFRIQSLEGHPDDYASMQELSLIHIFIDLVGEDLRLRQCDGDRGAADGHLCTCLLYTSRCV